MQTPTASKAGFFDNLAFRPQPGIKRKRHESPTPDNGRAGEAESFAALASRLEQATETKLTPSAPGNNDATHVLTSHDTDRDAKRRRVNSPGDKTQADESLAAVVSQHTNAAATPEADTELTVDSLSLNSSVAQRVARRRRVAVDPFIPKKKVIKKAFVRKQPRPAPVFGLASLITADKAQLFKEVRRQPPQTKIAMALDHLPAPARDPRNETVHMNAHEKLTVVEGQTFVNGRGFNEVVVAEKSHCVCEGLSEDALVPCVGCAKAYHPACVGKGRPGRTNYRSVRQRYLDDVKFYLKQGGFACPDCDKKTLVNAKKPATNPGKDPLTVEELNAEKQRKRKLFATRNNLKDVEPRECDNCMEEIISTRYECRYCVNFDFCRECYTDPAISSTHQHAPGDMVLR